MNCESCQWYITINEVKVCCIDKYRIHDDSNCGEYQTGIDIEELISGRTEEDYSEELQ